jgi:hypothetical protein
MKIANIITVILFSLIISGCSTSGYFKVPNDSKLYINNQSLPVQIGTNGEVTTRPFFWTVAGIPPNGGIPYRLEKDGKIIKAGKLRTRFRVVSIFWPPYAFIYWPMGFNSNITYDLVNDKQK